MGDRLACLRSGGGGFQGLGGGVGRARRFGLSRPGVGRVETAQGHGDPFRVGGSGVGAIGQRGLNVGHLAGQFRGQLVGGHLVVGLLHEPIGGGAGIAGQRGQGGAIGAGQRIRQMMRPFGGAVALGVETVAQRRARSGRRRLRRLFAPGGLISRPGRRRRARRRAAGRDAGTFHAGAARSRWRPRPPGAGRPRSADASSRSPGSARAGHWQAGSGRRAPRPWRGSVSLGFGAFRFARARFSRSVTSFFKSCCGLGTGIAAASLAMACWRAASGSSFSARVLRSAGVILLTSSTVPRMVSIA